MKDGNCTDIDECLGKRFFGFKILTIQRKFVLMTLSVAKTHSVRIFASARLVTSKG